MKIIMGWMMITLHGVGFIQTWARVKVSPASEQTAGRRSRIKWAEVGQNEKKKKCSIASQREILSAFGEFIEL